MRSMNKKTRSNKKSSKKRRSKWNKRASTTKSRTNNKKWHKTTTKWKSNKNKKNPSSNRSKPIIKCTTSKIYFSTPSYNYPSIRSLVSYNQASQPHNYHKYNNLLCQYPQQILSNSYINCILKNRTILNIWRNIGKRFIEKKLQEVRSLMKKIDRINIKMLNVKFVLMEIILMIISLFFVVCAT